MEQLGKIVVRPKRYTEKAVLNLLVGALSDNTPRNDGLSNAETEFISSREATNAVMFTSVIGAWSCSAHVLR